MLRPFFASLFCVFLLLAGLGSAARAEDGDDLQQRIAQQAAKLAELKAVVAENPKLKGLEGLIREVESNLRTLQAKARVDDQVGEAHAHLATQQAALAKRRAEYEERRADLEQRQAEMAAKTGLSTVAFQRALREKAELAAQRQRAREVAKDGQAPDERWEAQKEALRQQLAEALAAKDPMKVHALKAQHATLQAQRAMLQARHTEILAQRARRPAEFAPLLVRAPVAATQQAVTAKTDWNRQLEARFDTLRQQLADALEAKDRQRVNAIKAQLSELKAVRTATARSLAARRRVAAPTGGAVAKIRHLREAAKHLQAAGYTEQAQGILREAAKLEAEARRNAESAALLRVLRSLRQEVGQLRKQVQGLKKQLDER